MSNSRRPVPLRRNDVPQNYLLSWKSAGAKRHMRRPPTACLTCRAAKVKCNGAVPVCSRCTGRGIDCKYTTPTSLNKGDSIGAGHSPMSAQTAPSTLLTPTEMWTPSSPAVPDDITADIGMADTDQLDFSYVEYEQASEKWSEWVNGIAFSGPGMLDLLPTSMNDSKFLLASSTEISEAGSTPAIGSVISAQVSTQPELLQQESAQISAPSAPASNSPEGGSSESAMRSPNSPQISLSSLPHQRTPTDSCLCRAGVVLMVPRVKDALAEQQPDLVFRVTEDVIKGCQKIMECAVSAVKCTDLICIMSVLQHTDACFEFVAKAELANGIRVTLGDFEASASNQAKLGDILVSDLVGQAHALLDSIETTRERMSVRFEAHCRPSLAHINLDYLKAVTGNFRDVLNSTTATLDRPDSHSSH